MRSIKSKMIICMCALVSVCLVGLAFVSILLNAQTTRGVLQQTMLETAELAADTVSIRLEVFTNAAREAGLNSVIGDPEATPEAKQAVLDRFCEQYPGLTRGNVIGADGISIMNGTDYSDREYFQKSMAGDTWISDPLVAKSTGEVSIIISAPVWQNGVAGGTVAGVLFFVPAESFLNDVVTEVKISEGAAAQIINAEGTIVAHPNPDMVKDQHNSIAKAKGNPALAAIAALETEQIKGSKGFGTYTMGGVEKFLAYGPIRGTNGWTIGVNAPVDDFMSYTLKGVRYTIIILVVSLACAAAISILFAGSITKPLKRCAKRLSLLAEGDLTTAVPTTRRKDETGVLLHSLDSCVTNLHDMIQDVSYTLGEVADGNLTVTADKEYHGDFVSIHTAMQTIIASLNALLSSIADATEMVSSNASQISLVSQSLAETSIEQASSISELSQSMELVAERASHSTELARQMADSGQQVSEVATVGAEQMVRMMAAVQEINEAGQSIERVIKVIDDIAFQTNILALNAAVEAARAGEHGKGFAVVADEVRNLAGKSAEAARDTAALISNTITKAEEGYSISRQTQESLEQIMQGIKTVTDAITDIHDSSEVQAHEIDLVNGLLETQSTSINHNSASSQETAASSEEMASQSTLLRQLVSRFHLQKSIDGADRRPQLPPAAT